MLKSSARGFKRSALDASNSFLLTLPRASLEARSTILSCAIMEVVNFSKCSEMSARPLGDNTRCKTHSNARVIGALKLFSSGLVPSSTERITSSVHATRRSTNTPSILQRSPQSEIEPNLVYAAETLTRNASDHCAALMCGLAIFSNALPATTNETEEQMIDWPRCTGQ